MEIYALYNGKRANFNDELNNALNTGKTRINFISLQVVFDDSSDEFGSDEFTKFTMFNVDMKHILAMFPYKIVTVKHEGKDLKYMMFRVIIDDFAAGYFVKSKKEIGSDVNIFDGIGLKSDGTYPEVVTLNQADYEDFITAGHYGFDTFVCSYTRAPC